MSIIDKAGIFNLQIKIDNTKNYTISVFDIKTKHIFVIGIFSLTIML